MTPEQYYGLIAVFLSICFGLLTAKIASDKGGSFVLWFVAGTLLAIIALPLAIFLRPEQIGPASFKKCPKCAEQIRRFGQNSFDERSFEQGKGRAHDRLVARGVPGFSPKNRHRAWPYGRLAMSA